MSKGLGCLGYNVTRLVYICRGCYIYNRFTFWSLSQLQAKFVPGIELSAKPIFHFSTADIYITLNFYWYIVMCDINIWNAKVYDLMRYLMPKAKRNECRENVMMRRESKKKPVERRLHSVRRTSVSKTAHDCLVLKPHPNPAILVTRLGSLLVL